MKKSLRISILIPVIIALLIGIGVQILATSTLSSATTKSLSSQMVEQTVNSYANQFSSMNNIGYGALPALVSTFKDYVGMTGERDNVIASLKDMLAMDESLFGVWVCWEPNAFDGEDELYRNSPYHDSTGRFAPYVHRKGVEVLKDYTDPTAGAYYQVPLKTEEVYLTDPFYYEAGGTQTLLYSIAMPIIKNGKALGVIGVDIDMGAVNAVMSKASFLEEGYITVISPSGSVATNPKEALLLTSYQDSWLKEFSGQLDGIINNGGSFETTAYSSILNSDVLLRATGVQVGDYAKNWLVLGIVPLRLVNEPTNTLVFWIVVIAVSLIVLVSVVIILVLRKKLKPLAEVEAAAKSLANGQLNVQIKHRSQDELGSLADSMRSATATLRMYVEDIAGVMETLAEGSFQLKPPQQHFIGDFEIIETSTLKMVSDMSETLSRIDGASGQVSSGSNQVSSGAQALAQGATEQASSIEELSASIMEVSNQVKQNAENAAKASTLAATATDAINSSNRQMNQLMESMADIDAKSKEISKIIKTIEDIAFQTNILALNAAVEAARAGSAGKGFAVVADEVRNLAGKSAEAAKNTTQLIEDSVQAISHGVSLTSLTAEELRTAVLDVMSTTEVITQITKASTDQAQAIGQITVGIDQISAVVQTNSATSEESAAASQELSGQAEMLKQLVARFTLIDTGSHASPPTESTMRKETVKY